MLCDNPFVKGRQAYGCGSCLPCRINRRRIWAHRIMLEANLYEDNSFVTLTYSPETVPRFGSTGRSSHWSQCVRMTDEIIGVSSLPPGGLKDTLFPKDVQKWLKRIRYELHPQRIRFFLVGEYGEQTFRPHYHAALFGFPPCERASPRLVQVGRGCCPSCDLVARTWGHGGVHLGRLNQQSANYIARYVTKKMTSPDDPRLEGRHPEFTRMSLRPGIGHDAMFEVASEMMRLDLDVSQADVPSRLRHGARLSPLGRYLRMKLRKMVGKDEKAPAATIKEMEEEVRAVYEGVAANTPLGGDHRRYAFRDALVKASRVKRLQLEKRTQIFKQKDRL
jgi:hypothetical protein